MLQRIPVAHAPARFSIGHQGIETLRLHLRAANAEEHGIRQALLQRRDQMTGEQIPGGLACHHGNTNGVAHVSG